MILGTLVWLPVGAALLAEVEAAVEDAPLEVAVMVDPELLAVMVIMELEPMADELKGVPDEEGAADEVATPVAPATWKRGRKLYSLGLESSTISMV